MSTGLVICSVCHREVHQDGPVFDQVMTGERMRIWTHCETKTRICEGGTATYPSSDDEIVGRWCGADRAPEDRPRPNETRQQRRARERKEDKHG